MRGFDEEKLGAAAPRPAHMPAAGVRTGRMRTALGRFSAGASLIALAIGAPEAADAAEARSGAEDRSRYRLFSPLPKQMMRELSTDRPDMTESPYTVDAGHLQVEADVVSLSREEEVGVRHERWGVATTNLKVGLSHRIDAQLIVPLFQRNTDRSPLGEFSKSGVGDATARLKLNLWGNDGGSSAMAVMPYVSLPTSTLGGSSLQAGVILPLALELPRGFGAGVMLVIGVEDENGTPSATATLGHSLFGPLSGYVEAASATLGSDASRQAITSFNTGLTWSVGPDLQLDGGVVMATTSQESGDFTGFLGLAVRR